MGEELGHGFFGSVHRGVWREELEVAIKTLRDRHGKDQKGGMFGCYLTKSNK